MEHPQDLMVIIILSRINRPQNGSEHQVRPKQNPWSMMFYHVLSFSQHFFTAINWGYPPFSGQLKCHWDIPCTCPSCTTPRAKSEAWKGDSTSSFPGHLQIQNGLKDAETGTFRQFFPNSCGQGCDIDLDYRYIIQRQREKEREREIGCNWKSLNILKHH